MERIGRKTHLQQECIPIECIPSAAVAVRGGGVVLPVTVSARGGVCLPRGCLPARGGLPAGWVSACHTPL